MLDTACCCNKMRRAARAVTKLYDEVLAPSGLQVTQFSLLRTIERLQEEPSIGTLARATGLDRSTLGRNLRVLQKQGLLRLGPGGDERTRLVTLTEAGRSAISRTLPLWEAAQARVGAVLGTDKQARLFALLDELEAA